MMVHPKDAKDSLMPTEGETISSSYHSHDDPSIEQGSETKIQAITGSTCLISCAQKIPTSPSYVHTTRSSSPQKGGSIKQPGTLQRAEIRWTGERVFYLPGHDEPVTKKTCLTFSNRVRVRHIVPVHELMEDPETLWYQDNEYNQIQKKCCVVAGKAMKGEMYNRGKKLCIRGLESIINPEGRRCAQLGGWDTVLRMQDIQRNRGIVDEEYIRQMYQKTSWPPCMEALRRGLQDMKEVQTISTPTGSRVENCFQGESRFETRFAAMVG